MAQKSRIKTYSGSVTIANGGTTVTSAAAYMNGLVRAIYVNAPTLSNSDTYTLTITGPNSGQTLFTKASLVASSKTNILADANNYPLQIPIDGMCTITITSSGTEGADRVFGYSFLVEAGSV